MKNETIDYLAYRLQKNKEEGHGAIVFIGAGCSVSAGIPVASIIVDEILRDHKDNPRIEKLSKSSPDKPSYSDLMECLEPSDRNAIFKSYVKNAKINVSHIYLAHLLEKGYVDYIVTVNFDNLAQRALALYNIFPATYDISILKEMPDRSLDIESITYLHGHYNGLWQLNTKAEMNIIIENNVAKTIFDKITIDRLWIVVGYSGQDPIFEQLEKVNRFYKGLYWVGYKDNEPSIKVQNGLLSKANTESYWVKGYDADSFFLKLNSELGKLKPDLGNEHPKIFDAPLSFLAKLQEGINDIDDSDEYKSVKERFIASKEMVKEAINTFEINEENLIRNALIDCLINQKYNDLGNLEIKVNEKGYSDLLPIIADIYFNWGTDLGASAESSTGDEAVKLYIEAFEKYKAAIAIKPDYHDVYNNWGAFLGALAKSTSGDEAVKLYNESFEKYKAAIAIKPDKHEAYYNWGTNLGALAKVTSGDEAVKLYKDAIEKYKAAIAIKPDKHEAYYNWGTFLGILAKSTSGDEAVKLYNESFEKYKKVVEIKPDYHEAYNNWGIFLGALAKSTSGDEAAKLYNESFEKFKAAIVVKPDSHEIYFNWADSILNFAQTKSGQEATELYSKAFELSSRSVELGGSSYNLACVYSNTNKLEEAFQLLESCLKNNKITFDHVDEDPDWQNLRQDPRYLSLKTQYST